MLVDILMMVVMVVMVVMVNHMRPFVDPDSDT
jgi:hypothetical protein